MKNEVWIFIAENKRQLSQNTFNRLLKTMPIAIQLDVSKYRRWQDQQATLLGKWLLKQGLLKQGLLKLQIPSNAINYMALDDFKRPFLKKLSSELDFNISHSEGIVVCALSRSRIGIDVEKIRVINIEEYHPVFTSSELKSIDNQYNTFDTFDTFFKYWTRKEAIMKADGRGFYLEPISFEAIEKKVKIKEQQWYLHRVDVDHFFNNTATPLFQCNIATQSEQVLIHKYFFNTNDIEQR